MHKKSIFLFIWLLFFIPMLSAADLMPIAIMEMEAISVPKDTAKAVSDLLRTALFNTGKFNVLERTEMDKVLKEQQLGLSGLTDIEKAVKVGKLLSAKKILVGTVSKLGKSYIVNARIIDVEKGQMEFADNAKAESETDLDSAVEIFAKKIANRIDIKENTISGATSGAANKKSGSLRLKTPGLILMGAGLVSGGASLLFGINAKNAYDKYTKLAVADTAGWTKDQWNTEWDKVAKPSNLRDTLGLTGAIAGGAGVVLFAVDYFFLKKKSGVASVDESNQSWNIALGDNYKVEYSYKW